MPFKAPRLKPKFSDLKSILSQSGATDEPLYQTIEILLERLDALFPAVTEVIETSASSVAIHAPTHEPGGTDPIVNLNGSTITSGTVVDARLSSNIALKNTTNIFTASQILSLISPIIQFNDTAQGANLKAFYIRNQGQFFTIEAVSDAGVVLSIPITLNRAGDVFLYRDLIANIGTIFAQHIQFPATQVPSSNVNTLDDYEEGTTSVTDLSGAGLAITGGSTWTKIGRKILVVGQITYPVTANGSGAGFSVTPVNAASNSTFAIGYSQVDIRLWLQSGTVSCVPMNPATNAQLTNAQMSNALVSFSGLYYV